MPPRVLGVPLHNLSILHVIANPSVRLFAGPGRRIAQLFSAGMFKTYQYFGVLDTNEVIHHVGFDIATLEMFGTLCYGGTLVLKEPTDPFEHLKRVHAAIVTPSVLSACSPNDYPHLDTIVVGGEPVPQSVIKTWGDGRRLINGYGPSEVCFSRPTDTQTCIFP